MITHLNDQEEFALQGLPLMAQVLYIRGIRRYMDSATGLVGVRRKICYQSLIETVYVEPLQGRKPEKKVTSKKLRVMIKNLIDAGLLESRTTGKQLVFFCILADSRFQVQKKEGRGRAEEGQTKQGRPNPSNDAALPEKMGSRTNGENSEKKGIHQLSNINTLSTPPISPPNLLEPIPDDFAVTDMHRDMSAMMGAPNPEQCVDAFIGHHRSRGTVSANWDEEFRKWLAREREYGWMSRQKQAKQTKSGAHNAACDKTSEQFANKYAGLKVVKS